MRAARRTAVLAASETESSVNRCNPCATPSAIGVSSAGIVSAPVTTMGLRPLMPSQR